MSGCSSPKADQPTEVSLPLLKGTGRPRSTMGKWRAIALTAVHVLIAIHIAQWLIMGSTLSPVEPSESMKTLELGVVNAGFIFFTVAILSTLIFGRFFCGWGCHVVALQDLCAWMMKKLGTKPKPFRSRLLLFAPLLLGLYMFVWPTFKRFALFPALDAVNVAAPAWLAAPAAVHGFESELIVQDFWATFPPWYVAIPFLGVCGFACVYFLGSKGFCAYGCPYGGIFGVVDRASPGRIVVSDACEGCGHCTAVCTSNVRVHEEVRDFGAVVNPGCMKCLDCVNACPKDALSFGMTKPAMLITPRDDAAKGRQKRLARSPRRYDLTWPEEIAIAVVAFGCFVGFRGMLNLVPMLMAVGMALVAAYLVWAAYRTLRVPNVRVQSVQLRSSGRIRWAGVAVIACAVLLLASAGWSASVNWLRWTAHLRHESLGIPMSVALRPEFDPSPDQAIAVRTAIDRFERSAAREAGGFGWTLRPQDRRELAFLYVLDDQIDEAVTQLERLADQGEPTTELVSQTMQLRDLNGESAEQIAASLADVLARHAHLHDVRVEMSSATARLGTPRDELFADWDRVLAVDDSDAARLAAARSFLELGWQNRAMELARAVAESVDSGIEARIRAVRLLIRAGQRDSARANLLEIVSLERREPHVVRELADALATVGERDRARDVLDQGLEQFRDSASLHEASALLALVQGDVAKALAGYAAAAELSTSNPFALAGIGETIVRAGLGSRNGAVLDLGLSTMRQAAETSSHAVLYHDLGQALFAAGRRAEAIAAFTRAAELAPSNAALAQAVAAARAGG